MVSVIIPTYNEASCLGRLLDCLAQSHGDFEVLVTDGESEDNTAGIVTGWVAHFPHRLRLLVGSRPRALQLNRAAEQARGDVLLFLHADTELPVQGLLSLETALKDAEIVGGNFRVRFNGPSWADSLFSSVYHLRRRFGVYYGDSGIFIRRRTFEQLGGFKPIPIMEDYEFVRRLERAGRTTCLEPELQVSDRRWREQGVWSAVARWVWIETLFCLGFSPHHLARFYGPVRENSDA